MARVAAYGSLFLAFAATQLSTASTAHAVPNDTIAQAAPLEPRKVIRATNAGAVTEPADLTLICPQTTPFGLLPGTRGIFGVDLGVRGAWAQRASVWWRFRRGPRTTAVSTAGSNFPTTLAVWRRAPGGPLELIGCDADHGVDSLVYLQRHRGRPGDHRIPPDPLGTEYFAQVGGCVGTVVPSDCGTGVGNIRLGVYEGLDETLLDFRFFITQRYVRVVSLRLRNLPGRTRVKAEWLGRGGEHDQGEKEKVVRRRTFDARRLTGRVRLRSTVSFIRLYVTARGRVGKYFDISPQPSGRAPRVNPACLFPGWGGGHHDCLYRKTRYREPRSLSGSR